jgi:hypothetical protein
VITSDEQDGERARFARYFLDLLGRDEVPVIAGASLGDTRYWAVLKAHLDRWFEAFYPGTLQHDPLTLSAALELPFVDFDFDAVAVDADGRMSRDPAGRPLFLSRAARYEAILGWLDGHL